MYHSNLLMESEREEISVPLNSTHSSFKEAYDTLIEHGSRNGYGIKLKRSKPHHSEIKTRYYYRCDKHGNYKSQATVRQTSSRTTGCPFSIIIHQDSDQWQLRVQNGFHNHLPSLHPSTHHVFRKRTPSQKDSIQSMSRAGVAPKQILTAIRQEDPHTYITARDIWNERTGIRTSYLGERSPIEALLDDLSTPEWIFDVRKDSENHVQYLFFAHKKQIELLRANLDVLLMDCTYRTNKFKLPLLHILGCTNLGTFFSAGFCFLRNETQQDYHWAVSTFLNKTEIPHPQVFISDQEDALKSAVRELLPPVPQLLCVWHINRNVQTKAQQVWRDADGTTKEEKEKILEKRSQFMTRWNQVVYARNEVEFNSKWKSLLNDYRNQQILCDYLQQNQYQTRFEWAAAWTSRYRHYNTISTSPVEGMHKVLKDYLMTSQGDLLRVVQRIKAMIENQYSKYRKDIATARHSIKFHHRSDSMPYLPPGIHDIITPAAIEHIRQQFLLYQRDLRERRTLPCSGSFERIYGLPCRHTIQNWRDIGVRLRLDHIRDPHWYYQRPQGGSIELPQRTYQHILDPLPVQGRGRPRRDEASTRRDPSAFEQPVPPTPETNPQSLLELLQQTLTARPSTPPSMSISVSAPISIALPASISAPISAPVSLSIPITLSPSGSSPRSSISINVSIPISITPSPSSSHHSSPSRPQHPPTTDLEQPSLQQPPSRESSQEPSQPVPNQMTWEEFLADIEHHKSLKMNRAAPVTDIIAFERYLEETGQQNDSSELIHAREAALATTGIYANWTPEMAYNYFFGSLEAFYSERFAQVRASQAFAGNPAQASRRPKRAAAEQASAAWAGLGPRKRQRRQ